MPWMNKLELLNMVRDVAALRAEVIAKHMYVESLERRIVVLDEQCLKERSRAEAAIDEMTALATMYRSQPVAGEARQRAGEKADVTKLDNIFEEESEEGIKEMHSRIEAGEDVMELYEGV